MKNKLLKQFITAFLIVATLIVSATAINAESVVTPGGGGGGGSTTYTLTVTATFHDYNGTYTGSTSRSFPFKKGSIVGYDNISSSFPESYGWNGKNYHLQYIPGNVTMNSNKTLSLAYAQGHDSGGGTTPTTPSSYTVTVKDCIDSQSGYVLGSGTYTVSAGSSAYATVLRSTTYSGYRLLEGTYSNNVSSNITLYRIFNRISTYTVSYNGNCRRFYYIANCYQGKHRNSVSTTLKMHL